jgi:hypothetical protein
MISTGRGFDKSAYLRRTSIVHAFQRTRCCLPTFLGFPISLHSQLDTRLAGPSCAAIRKFFVLSPRLWRPLALVSVALRSVVFARLGAYGLFTRCFPDQNKRIRWSIAFAVRSVASTVTLIAGRRGHDSYRSLHLHFHIFNFFAKWSLDRKPMRKYVIFGLCP